MRHLFCVRFKDRLTDREVHIHGGKFALSLGWTCTQGGTYLWREVCVKFRMDLHSKCGTYFVLGLRMDLDREVHIHGGKFVLSLGWTCTQGGTYSWREFCVRFRMHLHTEGDT